MREHPGKRLAVVIGAHHKPYLEILLRKRGDVKVLLPGKDVPFPDASQVKKAWTTRDLVVTLGHVLDAKRFYFNASLIDLPRARRILGMLESKSGSPGGEQDDAVRYFRARILVLEGKPEAAARDLDALLEKAADGEIYPFPMREWRMCYTLSEAVRLEKARILLDRGRREEAKALLAPVARALDERLRRLEKTHPRKTRRVEAVKDAGFERGSRASDYFSGWYTYLPTGQGKLRFAGDEKVKREGERSLRIEVVDPVPHTYGFHIRQEVRIPLSENSLIGFDLESTSVARASNGRASRSCKPSPVADPLMLPAQLRWFPVNGCGRRSSSRSPRSSSSASLCVSGARRAPDSGSTMRRGCTSSTKWFPRSGHDSSRPVDSSTRSCGPSHRGGRGGIDPCRGDHNDQEGSRSPGLTTSKIYPGQTVTKSIAQRILYVPIVGRKRTNDRGVSRSARPGGFFDPSGFARSARRSTDATQCVCT